MEHCCTFVIYRGPLLLTGGCSVTSAAAHLRAGCGLCCRNLLGLGPAPSPDTDTRRG